MGLAGTHGGEDVYWLVAGATLVEAAFIVFEMHGIKDASTLWRRAPRPLDNNIHRINGILVSMLAELVTRPNPSP